MKNRAEILAEKLRPNTVLEKLWQHISVNFIIKLPVSRSHNMILIVYDRFSKMLYFIVMTEKVMVKELTRLFKNNVWKLHELSESVISDKRPHFAVGLIKELNEMLEI